MAKTEKTSKRVAAKAGKLMKRIDAAMEEIKDIERDAMFLNARTNTVLPMVRGILMDAKAVAASAPTQTEEAIRVTAYCSEVETDNLNISKTSPRKGDYIIQRDGKPFMWPEREP